ncbi:methionine ABC transporter ATP-binding protein [Leucobacter massiliensis]|uniref:Methionine ABC transporter ATP-binding protein n=1 Tax=Leucobacter massiliensis TaxID=1686285 RepID=A0A2S9QRF6_9MICO|nr:methionine ABC transporter ATP-binding protein [Leucobacter massiliensis]PRI12169.1 methionine ABC transporter ATP-binding protein [Leucobacter massiliensis]
MTRVSIAQVSKEYPARGRSGGTVTAVDEVSIEVASGEIHAIIGYSGAGKSTLLRLINGLERVTSGRILVGDQDISAMRERELRRERTGIGMIFQHFNLLRSRTVSQNVAYPLVVAGAPKAERARRVVELLSFVGLADKASAYPEQLSGGQKQRVGIARALATNPGVLLADEATSALDPETSQEVLALLRRVNAEFGITIILITHEMEVVRGIAHRVTVMDGGRAVEQGDVFDVFARPQTDTARRFVATALPTRPDPAHLLRLREQHRGKLVAVTFADGRVDQPIVFRTLAERGIDVSIVHGGVTEVGGRSFGTLTLELIGDELQVEHGIAALGQQAELEVLA